MLLRVSDRTILSTESLGINLQIYNFYCNLSPLDVQNCVFLAKNHILHAPKLTDKNPHWMEIPKMLVEDALNVLVEDYNNPKDIFHMLCAANLINTYTNRYKYKNKMALKAKKNNTKRGRMEKVILHKRVHIMYGFKNQVMETIVKLLKIRSRHLKVATAHVFASVVSSAPYSLLFNFVANVWRRLTKCNRVYTIYPKETLTAF